MLLVNDYATDTAGAERITRSLRDALRATGHDVRVFASDARLIAGDSFADVTCRGTSTRAQTLVSMWNTSASRMLHAELAAFRPDVVQVHMFLWQLSPSILSLLANVPSVYYAMTYKAVCPTGTKCLPSGRQCQVTAGMACVREGCVTSAGFVPLMLQRRLWRRRRHAFSAIVACSHALRARFEDDDVAVTDVIWPGTPEATPRLALNDTPTVTFAGRLDRTKGAGVLLQAFARVRAQMPAVRLRVAGTGPDEAHLRELAGALSLGPAVEFAGHLDGVALESLLASSWVHAVPSIWAEPFGITTTEAMMRGVAVVGSNTGGIAESVVDSHTGYLVPPGDASALADALLTVLRQPEEAMRLGANARARALAHFTLRDCAARFAALYGELTAGAST